MAADKISLQINQSASAFYDTERTMIYLLMIKAQSYIMKINFCFTSLNIVKLLHQKKRKERLILRWFGGNI